MRRLFAILLILVALGGTVQAQEPLHYFPLLFKGTNTMSDFKIVVPEATTNKCLNPSAETTGNFAAAGATVTRSASFQKYGLYSYRVQTAANNQGIELTLSALTNAIHYVTVRVRGTLPTTWDWSLDDTTYTEPSLIEQIDSNWAVYGLQFPAAQANGSTTLYIDQNGSGSGDFYLDGIQVEAKEYWTTYCDGTQDGCQWLGTAHATASERSSQSRAGGRVQDLQTDYSFNITGFIDGGVSPQRVGVDSYAILPGGELNNIKINSRVFTMTGVFNATSQAQWHSQRQALVNVLLNDNYPADQPILLRYEGATVHKEIAVYYEGGLEGELSSTEPCYWERQAIRFIAPDPYWYEIGESGVVLDTNDSATFRYVAGRLRSTGQWSALGPPSSVGDPGGGVEGWAVAEDDTYVYFGGYFINFDGIANADYIVRWHKQNQSYSALGSGLNGQVRTLKIGPNGDLYIGGNFTNAGGVASADYFTRWDGSNYNAIGIPNTGTASINSVEKIEIDQAGNIYIGGDFTNWADIANADRIVMWDGSSYSALSTGVNAIVRGIATGIDNTIYIGGSFTSPFNYITAWDGSSFSSVGTLNNAVFDIAVDPGSGLIYIGGAFTSPGNRIVSYNGTEIVALGSGASANVLGLGVAPDGTLWVGGSFSQIGELSVTNVAIWNGFVFAPLDVNIPNSPTIRQFAFGNEDPVIKQNYSVWFSHIIEDTGTFAGKVTPDNEGTARSFPRISYNRSGGTSATLTTLRNERTGKELLFDYDLQDGETLTIDLEPTQKSSVSSFFGSRLDAILPNSDFGTWSLLPGDNDVTSFVDTAGGPTITAGMIWREAYNGYD